MKKFALIILIVLIGFSFVGCTSSPMLNTSLPIGVWWWNDQLGDEYLEFANKNSVQEIYLCTSNFDEETASFISKAENLNMKVYALWGEYEWLDDFSSLTTKIEKYLQFQNSFPSSNFEGIHLDIEPHQNPLFQESTEARYQLIYNLIHLAYTLSTTYPSLTFDYDIPFWLDDVITYNGQTKEAYKFMIDLANRVFLMSYRDSAEKIFDVSKEELAYAKSSGKTIFLGVETSSSEGDNVSFMEEGKKVMYQQINKLASLINQDFGISIHQIYKWKHLKN